MFRSHILNVRATLRVEDFFAAFFTVEIQN